MGDLLKQYGQAANKMDIRADTSDPGLMGPGPESMPSLAGLSAPDMSQVGMTQAVGQNPGGGQALGGAPDTGSPDMSQSVPTMPDVPQMPQMPDNPFTPYDNSPVQDISSTVGTNDVPAPTQQGDNSDDSIEVSPAFHPHHVHGLASVADFLLGGLLSRGADKKNMEESMQGFTHDPEEVIKRIATFNPKLALTLQERYVDNKRQQGVADRQFAAFDMTRDKAVMGVVANAINSVDPKDSDAMKQMADRMRKYATAKGATEVAAMIPDDFSKLDRQALTMGQLTVAKQESLKRSDRRLDQGDTRLGIQDRDVTSKIGRRNAETSQGKERLTNQEANRKSTGLVNTEYGPGVVKTVGSSKFLSVVKDGVQHVYVGTDGVHWKHYGSKPVK